MKKVRDSTNQSFRRKNSWKVSHLITIFNTSVKKVCSTALLNTEIIAVVTLQLNIEIIEVVTAA